MPISGFSSVASSPSEKRSVGSAGAFARGSPSAKSREWMRSFLTRADSERDVCRVIVPPHRVASRKPLQRVSPPECRSGGYLSSQRRIYNLGRSA